MRSLTGILLIAFVLTSGCGTSNVNSEENVLYDQEGILRWGGSPIVDGVGMLFIVGKKEFGAPGTPDDYPGFFRDDITEVHVRADFKITGAETVRGWGATFPAIEFLDIEKM